MPEVASEIHGRHATAAELALDLVASGERCLKVIEGEEVNAGTGAAGSRRRSFVHLRNLAEAWIAVE